MRREDHDGLNTRSVLYFNVKTSPVEHRSDGTAITESRAVSFQKFRKLRHSTLHAVVLFAVG